MSGSRSDFKLGRQNLVSNDAYLSHNNDINLSQLKEDSADE